MEYDLHSNSKVTIALKQQSITVGPANGVVFDTLGFESTEYIVNTAAVGSGSYILTFQESDEVVDINADPLVMQNENAVPDDLILGNTFVFEQFDGFVSKRVGIISKKRFQRMIVVATTTGSWAGSAAALLSNPLVAPTADSITNPS